MKKLVILILICVLFFCSCGKESKFYIEMISVTDEEIEYKVVNDHIYDIALLNFFEIQNTDITQLFSLVPKDYEEEPYILPAKSSVTQKVDILELNGGPLPPGEYEIMRRGDPLSKLYPYSWTGCTGYFTVEEKEQLPIFAEFEIDGKEEGNYQVAQLSVLEASAKGVKLLIENNSGEMLSVSSEYILEIFENGKWQEAPLLSTEPRTYNAVLYPIESGGSIEWSADFEMAYKTSQKGSYRILLPCYENGYDEPIKEHTVIIGFEIE